MPESNKYTTISVMEGIRSDLIARQEGDDTYSDVIRRLIEQREMSDDEFTHRLDRLERHQRQQSRLLVRIGAAMGLFTEEIPRELAEYESWGNDSPFEPSDESTIDIFDAEKQDELARYTAVLNERMNRDEYERSGDLPPRRRVGVDEMDDCSEGEGGDAE